MSGSGTSRTDGGDRFVCTECGTSLNATDSMKAALVEHGCVVCGADVTRRTFEESSSA